LGSATCTARVAVPAATTGPLNSSRAPTPQPGNGSVYGQAALDHHVAGDQVRELNFGARTHGRGESQGEARYASHL